MCGRDDNKISLPHSSGDLIYTRSSVVVRGLKLLQVQADRLQQSLISVLQMSSHHLFRCKNMVLALKDRNWFDRTCRKEGTK